MITIEWHIATISMIALLAIFCFMCYFIYKITNKSNEKQVKMLPILKGDMTLSELKRYNGKGDDGRICIACLGKVYDVTRGET